jgi:hypothetical protein
VYATGALDTAIKNPQTGERDNTVMPNVFSTYEDVQSETLKLNFAKQHHLGGVFFWELSGDLPVSNPDSLVRRAADALLTPSIQAVQVNDGTSNQRSMVRSLKVTFNTQVTFTGTVASAFTLARIGGGAVGGFTATATVVNGQTVVTLNGFTGAETQNGSLADGRYTLRVLANRVSTLFGQLDGDGNGTPGDDYVLAGNTTNKLFRLFGDANGDGTVNAFDYSQFRSAYGSSTGQSAYVDWLDVNGDGVINAFDFGQLRSRFGSSVP